MPEVSLGNVPFEEAISYLKNKTPIPTKHWDDMLGEIHAKAFTVAGATKADLLNDIFGLVDDALMKGTTISDFRKGFDDAVLKHGWDFKGNKSWRTRVIYDTNLRTAHAAGRWQQFERQSSTRPYLHYLTVGDGLVRPEHQAWDDLILTIEDVFWNTHYPPNGWGCRCTVRSLSQSQLERMGRTVSESPEVITTERINHRSGEIYGEVPEGIDVGWDYNVGKASLTKWDPSALTPDCNGFDFSKESNVCLVQVPNQKTWQDYKRPDLRKVPVEYRTPAPEELPRAENAEAALVTLMTALGMKQDAKIHTITTPVNEMVVFDKEYLPHLVEKRSDARERYAGFVLPTLMDPYEVYLTDYGDGIRSRYIGLFQGAKYDMFVVVRRNKDGSILWNMIPRKDKDLNKLRVGELIYTKDE
jgi:SPP1 gp7 family putative phage head morphogenesis protein